MINQTIMALVLLGVCILSLGAQAEFISLESMREEMEKNREVLESVPKLPFTLKEVKTSRVKRRYTYNSYRTVISNENECDRQSVSIRRRYKNEFEGYYNEDFSIKNKYIDYEGRYCSNYLSENSEWNTTSIRNDRLKEEVAISINKFIEVEISHLEKLKIFRATHGSNIYFKVTGVAHNGYGDPGKIEMIIHLNRSLIGNPVREKFDVDISNHIYTTQKTLK